MSNGGRVHLLTHLIHQGVTQCKKIATGIQSKSTQPKKKEVSKVGNILLPVGLYPAFYLWVDSS